MPLEALLTFAVLLATVGLMALDIVSPDYLLLGALMVLAGAGVLEPSEAASGFSNPAVLAIGGLFLVAAGVRATGLIDRVTSAMFGEGASLRRVLARLTTLAASGSAFLSNTAIVAIGIPTLDRWARERGISPSKLLIPLSYASIIGGVSTLIGTSTNIVVDGLMRENGISGLGFFELAAVGVPLAVVVILYLTFVSPRLLPARESPETPAQDVQEYVAEMRLEPGSPLVDRTVEEAGLLDVQDLYVVRIARETGVIAPVEPGERLAADDRISFAGALHGIVKLADLEGLRPVTTAEEAPEAEPTWEFYQAVVTPGSPLVGTHIREAEFRARYNATVLAVQRRGEEIPESIAEVMLRPGDTLILEASPEFGRAHRESSEFFVVSPLEGTVPRRSEKQVLAAGVLAAMIASVAAGALTLPVAAPLAGLAMIATGCVGPDEARRSVDWSVLVAIGSAIGIARALEASGGAQILGEGIGALAGAAGHWGLLLGVFFGTVVLTELVMNQAAAALMFPIVLALAGAQGLDPRPLVLIATVAASLSFSTPLNYTTNLMVYGPGKYRFADFTRTGVPLQLVLSVVAVAVLQLVWPLQPA
ncbi:MAG: SLC13 family permease [Gemmatimonadota bacterium]